jgi:hypothetical protein
VDWTFVYLMFVLKIPILFLGWIVWWSTRPVDETAGTDDEGGQRTLPRPRHPRPPLPRHPRRGPHGDPRTAAPKRVRSVVARSRESA